MGVVMARLEASVLLAGLALMALGAALIDWRAGLIVLGLSLTFSALDRGRP